MGNCLRKIEDKDFSEDESSCLRSWREYIKN